MIHLSTYSKTHEDLADAETNLLYDEDGHQVRVERSVIGSPIIEALRIYLRTCPLLAGGRINVDFLPEKIGIYSIEAVPISEVIRQYVDGSSVRQFAFVIASREVYGSDIRQQIDNLGFFEMLSDWLHYQSKVRDLPDLGAGRTPLDIKTTTSGYAFVPDTDTARYQIQCRLEYFQQKGA